MKVSDFHGTQTSKVNNIGFTSLKVLSKYT